MNEEVLVFFDGVCGLCNGFVDFLMVRDKRNVFVFSPLQSEYAKKHLPEYLRPQSDIEMNSVVILYKGRYYQKSEAALLAISLLGGAWSLAKATHILPRFLRDQAYDLVAQKRYQWFGKKESCRLPTTEEKKKFRL